MCEYSQLDLFVLSIRETVNSTSRRQIEFLNELSKFRGDTSPDRTRKQQDIAEKYIIFQKHNS